MPSIPQRILDRVRRIRPVGPVKKVEERCKVGVGVIIVHKRHMLLGTRMGSHCAGELSFPGGHIDLEDESIESCGEREVCEEVLDPRTGAGLKVKVHRIANGRPQVFLRHDHMENRTKAYVTLFLKATLVDEEGVDLKSGFPSPPEELHKCAGWNWYQFPELCEKILGIENFTYNDLVNEDEATKAWIPLDLLSQHASELGISHWANRNETT